MGREYNVTLIAMPENLKSVDGTSRFPTTSWTLIVNARDLDYNVSREALGSFCGAYWYPVFAFIRRKECGLRPRPGLHAGLLCCTAGERLSR